MSLHRWFIGCPGTFRKADPAAEDTMIRINPNRAGTDTIINILKKAMASI